MADQPTRYQYTARNMQGGMVSGSITADSTSAAARRLQAMNLHPLTVTSTAKGKGGLKDIQIGEGKPVKAKHLALFSRQFATMTEAGLPLVRGLGALAAQADHPKLAEILPQVRADVEAGTAFSVSLSRHPRIFPPLMIGMVAAGEVSGSLAGAMNQVAENFEKEAKLKAKVFSAMLYPIIVLILAGLMVTGMLIFIVPKFAGIFDQLGGQLPLPTRILVGASNAMGIILPVGIVSGIAFSIWWRKNKNTPRVRNFLDPIKLRMPILGKFFQKISIARFARTFSTLLVAGVPMLQALEIVSATSGNAVVSAALDEVRTSVRAGKSVAVTLSEHPVFPPLVVQMISTGEETGAMPEMLTKIAQFYEQEVDTSAEGLTSILEPILIVLLASIVGVMVVSLYLPIFKVYELIQ